MLMLRLMVMTAPAIAVVAVLKPEILPALLRVAGAAIVNTLVVGALAGLHALLVVSLFRPGSGIDLWLALLVTGVVTVVLWAVARPFRRLVSMVSLTREQFGGIVPGAGTGPMSRVVAAHARRRRRRPAVALVGRAAQRGRGRRTATAASGPRPSRVARRPGAAPARVPRRRHRGRGPAAAEHPGGAAPGAARRTPAAWAGRRRAAAVGRPRRDRRPRRSTAGPTPSRCVPAAARPVQAELVDGVPVYRIYRPRPGPRTAGAAAVTG